MQFQFSNDVAKLQPSAIREILKFTSMPGVISFAAGNPAPEAFPTELIADLSSKLLREHPVMAKHYRGLSGIAGTAQAVDDRKALLFPGNR